MRDAAQGERGDPCTCNRARRTVRRRQVLLQLFLLGGDSGSFRHPHCFWNGPYFVLGGGLGLCFVSLPAPAEAGGM